jgi:hypothetical protein
VTAFGASAKMKPPPAQSRAFDATCSAWFGRWVDTIPLGLHRLLFDFRLLQLPSSRGGPKERYSIALISTGFGRDCRTSRCAALPRLGRPSPTAADRPPRPHVAGVYAVTTGYFHVSCIRIWYFSVRQNTSDPARQSVAQEDGAGTAAWTPTRAVCKAASLV